MIKKLKKYFQKKRDRWNQRRERHAKRRLRENVEKILSRNESPDTRRAESDFQLLQDTYPIYPPYGYDDCSIWRRSAARSLELLDLPEMQIPGKQILEIGCGDGMVSYWLRDYGHEVTLADAEDWRHARAEALTFHQMKVDQNWDSLQGKTFDLIFSYNAMEHFAAPDTALALAKKHLKPNGRIYLSFAPIYASPWGLHAYRTLKMPYPQFLFSKDFIQRKLDELGGVFDLGKQRSQLQFTNGWLVSQYENLWNSSGLLLEKVNRFHQEEHFDLIERYPECFQGRGLTLADISLCSYVLLLKNQERKNTAD